MRLLSRWLPVLVLVGGVAVLHADTPPGTPGEEKSEVAVGAPEKLTVAEMTTRSHKFREDIQSAARRLIFLRDQAKKHKDVIKLNCVNDKMVELKAQTNISDMIADKLEIALAEDLDTSAELYAQLASTSHAIGMIREEANACIGEPELFRQESGNDFSHPEFVDDPNVDPFVVEVEPPAYASPFN